MRPLVRLLTYFALPIVASFLLGVCLSKFILGKAASSDWLVFAAAFIIIVIGVVWLIVKRQKITPFRAILCLWCVLTMLAPVYDAVPSSFRWKGSLAIIMLILMLAVILIAVISVYRFFVTRRR